MSQLPHYFWFYWSTRRVLSVQLKPADMRVLSCHVTSQYRKFLTFAADTLDKSHENASNLAKEQRPWPDRDDFWNWWCQTRREGECYRDGKGYQNCRFVAAFLGIAGKLIAESQLCFGALANRRWSPQLAQLTNEKTVSYSSVIHRVSVSASVQA